MTRVYNNPKIAEYNQDMLQVKRLMDGKSNDAKELVKAISALTILVLAMIIFAIILVFTSKV